MRNDGNSDRKAHTSLQSTICVVRFIFIYYICSPTNHHEYIPETLKQNSSIPSYFSTEHVEIISERRDGMWNFLYIILIGYYTC